MSVMKIPKFPWKMEELLGPDGKEEFIDFLNDSFAHQEESVLQVVSDRFDRRVTEESKGIYVTVAKLDHRITEEVAKLDHRITEEVAKLDHRITEEIAKLDVRITREFSRVDKNIDGLRVMIAELRSEMKSDISAQTKWMFGGMMAAATLVTVALPLVVKFLFFA